MSTREIYLRGVKALLSKWSAQLEELRAEATARVGSAYQKQLDSWAGVDGIAGKLAELRGLDEKWYIIKGEVEKGLRSVEAALGRPQLDDPAGAESFAPRAVGTKARPGP